MPTGTFRETWGVLGSALPGGAHPAAELSTSAVETFRGPCFGLGVAGLRVAQALTTRGRQSRTETMGGLDARRATPSRPAGMLELGKIGAAARD